MPGGKRSRGGGRVVALTDGERREMGEILSGGAEIGSREGRVEVVVTGKKWWWSGGCGGTLDGNHRGNV